MNQHNSATATTTTTTTTTTIAYNNSGSDNNNKKNKISPSNVRSEVPNSSTNTITTSNIPKTPIPSSCIPYAMPHTPCTKDNDRPKAYFNSDMTRAAQEKLMLSTYSLVGVDYLDTLVDQIRTMTNAQSVLIQQVITMDECNNIIERLERQGIKINLFSTDDSSVDHDVPEEDLSQCLQLLGQRQKRKQKKRHQHLPYNNQLLLTRACSSSVSSEATSKYCVTPLVLLQDSPSLKTLTDGSFLSSRDNVDDDNDADADADTSDDSGEEGDNNNMMDFTHEGAFLPPHTSFVGIRLQGPNSLPLGLLFVCDDVVKDNQWYQDTYQLITSVATRTTRELEGVRDSERLVKAKNDATQDAENKIKFLADMSHEIRTPMNAVIALTDLLLQERSTLNDEQIEHLDVIQTSGHHLLTVINDILDISKINHDPKFKLESRRFSLRKCIKDALNMARHQASMSQSNKMVYVVECPADMDDNVPVQQNIASLERLGILPPSAPQYKGKVLLPLIWSIDIDTPDYLMGDTMRLTQILLNLCSNAVKFTKKGGIRVRIKRYVPTPMQHQTKQQSKLKQRYEAKLENIYTRAMQGKETKLQDNQEDGQQDGNDGAGASDDGEDTTRLEKTILEISVTDTGIGIPSDRLPRLFKSFSQIDISTARRYGGTGLGLAISSTLVNRMGGGLWVESEEGVGSRFCLTLPMTIALGRCVRAYGSESTTTSSFVTSPPSPSSSVSDGSSSVHSGVYERSDISSHANVMSPSQSSVSSGYFPSVNPQPSQVSSIQHPHRLRQQTSWSLFTPRHYQQPSLQQQQHQYASKELTSSITPPPQSSPEFLVDHGTHPLLPHNSSTPSPYLASDSLPIRPASSPSSSSSLSSSPLQHQVSHLIETKPDQKRPLLRRGDASQTGASFYAEKTRNHNHLDYLSSSSPPSLSPSQMGTTAASPLSTSPATAAAAAATSTTTTTTSTTPPNSGRAFRGSTASKHHHQRKNTNTEENFALMYPVKILLAEDNVLNQKIAISILKRLGYHDVVVTNNGKEALDVMRKVKFDVIFMDLYMPEMDGLEATREIISERKGGAVQNNNGRRLLNVDDVYIIALTASASNQDRQICIDAGMNDFISKPFTMMEMKASLKTCGNKRAKRRKQRVEDTNRHHHPNERQDNVMKDGQDDVMMETSSMNDQ